MVNGHAEAGSSHQPSTINPQPLQLLISCGEDDVERHREEEIEAEGFLDDR